MEEPTRTTSSDPVDSVMVREAALSEFWRNNISHVEAVELANLLRAVRKVAGTLGRNVGDIVYAGMSKAPGTSIVLDPEFVMGDYPVDPWKVDYLVGLVVHEALHKTEWSDLVWTGVESALPDIKVREKVALSKIVSTGEDIYVDSVSERSILGRYNRKVRFTAMDAMRSQLDPDVVSVDELAYMWWLSA